MSLLHFGPVEAESCAIIEQYLANLNIRKYTLQHTMLPTSDRRSLISANNSCHSVTAFNTFHIAMELSGVSE